MLCLYRLRGLSGVPAGLGVTGLVGVLVAGLVLAGLVVPPAGFAGAEAPLPLAGAAVLPVGVAAGAAGAVAGKDVNGVGSGGSGLESTDAMKLVSPAPVSVGLRYFHQVFRLSVHTAFCAAYCASLPAKATARA